MIRAILKNGTIQPLDPIPRDWPDGVALHVDAAEPSDDVESIDRWYAEVNALAAQIDPRDMARLEAALREADDQAKMTVRREMGLP